MPNPDPDSRRTVVTRFAPSPTGYMHLGHAYAALFAWREARRRQGRFLIRIEDIDRGRCRPAFEQAIFDDLSWLGIDWEGPVLRQSDRLDAYQDALDRLNRAGLLYPCFCTRSDIMLEIKQAAAAPHGARAHESSGADGPDGPVYPGTCRRLGCAERRSRLKRGRPHALRLDMAQALAATGAAAAGGLAWEDVAAGPQAADPARFGDVVLARKDTPTSYHLAATLDDDHQGVTLVTRGRDLFQASHVHRLLQALLGLAVPRWHHHALITDANGARLAKRNRAMTLRALRQAGKTPAQVRAMVGFT